MRWSVAAGMSWQWQWLLGWLLPAMVATLGACKHDTGLFDCSESGWCRPFDQPAGKTLRGVWGTSSQDVWVVGAAGTIGHFDGSTWQAMQSGTSANLYGVAGSSPTDVWAVGEMGTILHYDGSSWTLQRSSTERHLSAVFVDSSAQMWAVGQGGTIVHRSASLAGDFISYECGGPAWLTSIWGSGPERIWAVGQHGVLCRWDGKVWVMQPELTDSFEDATFTHVWGTSTQSAWILSDADKMYHFQGSGWVKLYCSGSMLSGWGKRRTMVTVGKRGTIRSYDGIGDYDFDCSLKDVKSGTEQTLLDVWGSATGGVWAVGTDGVILTYQSDAAGIRDVD